MRLQCLSACAFETGLRNNGGDATFDRATACECRPPCGGKHATRKSVTTLSQRGDKIGRDE